MEKNYLFDYQSLTTDNMVKIYENKRESDYTFTTLLTEWMEHVVWVLYPLALPFAIFDSFMTAKKVKNFRKTHPEYFI